MAKIGEFNQSKCGKLEGSGAKIRLDCVFADAQTYGECIGLA